MDNNGAQLLVTILGAGGGGAILLALVNALIKWLSGASARERERNAELALQRVRAIEEREQALRELDDEAKRRRKVQEYASSLRRQLLENGFQPAPWPEEAVQQPLRSKEETNP